MVGNEAITSATLSPLFKGGSANSAGFVLAVMKDQGLVQKMGESRAYERLDGKAFFGGVQALLGAPAKGSAKAAAGTASKAPRKAPTRGPAAAPAPSKAPVAYVTAVDGPLVPPPKKTKR